MKKRNLLFLIAFLFSIQSKAQTPKIVYAELGGPGLFSVNFDSRFSKREDGFGGRAGVGGFWFHNSEDGNFSLITVPVGVNYLLGKDGKHYFEVGVGYTLLTGNFSTDDDPGMFQTSFGNITLGYRLAPARGGFTFKAQMTPIFGNGYFFPFFYGVGFGYKF